MEALLTTNPTVAEKALKFNLSSQLTWSWTTLNTIFVRSCFKQLLFTNRMSSSRKRTYLAIFVDSILSNLTF